MGELLVLIGIGIVIILGFVVLIFFLLDNQENNEENYGVENKLLLSFIEKELNKKHTEKVIQLMIDLIKNNPKIEDEKAFRNLLILLEENKLKHKVNIEYAFKIFSLVKFIILNEQQNHH
ncbi:hypothetical protein [Oceanirhabdus sp. W0125-5]|uniref:hypothetical protein n=1 Tax=Oceanirhabdus sp. W0125-5 TaxID=2999116 RepID=UPI0022F2EDA6|nr:hypothetical protein [Oceanirhabdus sp. W0125-5]WBW95501.1 hypothetical protein OW730_17630 [Oceanirhabdus sp. W0125-5]